MEKTSNAGACYMSVHVTVEKYICAPKLIIIKIAPTAVVVLEKFDGPIMVLPAAQKEAEITPDTSRPQPMSILPLVIQRTPEAASMHQPAVASPLSHGGYGSGCLGIALVSEFICFLPYNAAIC